MKRRTFVHSTLGAALAAGLSGEHLLAVAGVVGDVPATVEAVRGNGERVTLTAAEIKELGEALRGRLLLAQSEGYDLARRVRNPIIDKHPALIVQASGVADVRTAVQFAHEHRLLLAVKSGGHSFSGQSTCDGGMMLDLSAMSSVRVDPAAKKAWVAGGTPLGLLDHEALSYGLITPMGTVSSTGVGGLTTGGGFGRLARRFGLATDNVTAVDVVTADGKLLHASAAENPDLFWGVRGGGGNFGVVTSFEFQLHPMQRKVIGGGVRFPFGEARNVLKFYADYTVEAPDELYIDCYGGYPAGNTEGALGLQICYSGDERNAEKAIAPIRRLAKASSDNIRSMDYLVAQGSNDIPDPRRALGSYMKTGLTAGISPALIAAILEYVKPHPQHYMGVGFQHAGGAIGRVRNDATAFAHRYATHNMMTSASWKVGEASDEHIRAARELWQQLEKHTRGFYVNDMAGDEGAAAVNANYKENYPRLVELKNKYDPGNLFQLNANVKPSLI